MQEDHAECDVTGLRPQNPAETWLLSVGVTKYQQMSSSVSGGEWLRAQGLDLSRAHPPCHSTLLLRTTFDCLFLILTFPYSSQVFFLGSRKWLLQFVLQPVVPAPQARVK